MDIKQALAIFYKNNPRYAVMANDELIVRFVQDNRVAIADAANRLRILGKLAVRAEHTDAFEEFYSTVGRPYAGITANTSILEEALGNRIATVEALDALLDNPRIKSQLVVSAAFRQEARSAAAQSQAEQAEAAEREAIKNEIAVPGKSDYSVYRATTQQRYGGWESYPLSGLDDCPIEEARQTLAIVREQRGLQGAQIDVARAAVKEARNSYQTPSGWPVFPKSIVLDNRVTPTIIDRNFLTSNNADADLLRKWKRIYGDEQITARLNGWD